MRIAVLSDIHSNKPALEAVINDYGNPDEIWFLGDLFGYGPYPLETYQIMRNLGARVTSVKGNHDDLFINNNPLFNGYALSAIQKNKNALENYHGYQSKILPLIKQLPSVVSPKPSVYFSHGAADLDQNDYQNTIIQYPDDENLRRMIISYNNHLQDMGYYPWVKNLAGEFASPVLILVGHQHERFFKVYNYSNQKIEETPIDFNYGRNSIEISFSLDSSSCRIVNPGSVGLTRDGENGYDPGNKWANYLILNISKNYEVNCEFHRIQYQVKELLEQLSSCGYPQEIIQMYS